MNAIRLALLQSQLEGVAEVMGQALARSAFSPNIRVRRDYSCALFSPTGGLLAQAAHIPVHLGSMPDQIVRLVETHPLEPNDIFIANDPYDGGTHLPDITLMEPVFSADRCIGIVAARAHHADVGGAAPASMANQANIYGEGLRIPILYLARGGRWDASLVELLLANMRSPGDREGDLLAQRAALHHGHRGLRRVFTQWANGCEQTWDEGRDKLWQAASLGTREALAQILPADRKASFTDHLEVGRELAEITVSVGACQSGMKADFQGTATALPCSFNATMAVTRAAVCYAVRCLIPSSIPLNQGFLDCIEISAPAGSLVSAVYPQAVAAGNVETSQRIVDTVFGALAQLIGDRIPAASAGTMNNFSFGFTDPDLGVHYETSGGGAGGCPGGPSQAGSALQVHMTNTLATPVEVLEEEFPVIVTRHELRANSGGNGVHSGGLGTRKELIFLADAEVTVMATRRTTTPYGLAGGEPGSPGDQMVREPGQEWEQIPASSTTRVAAGCSVRLDTPGGGGWGKVLHSS